MQKEQMFGHEKFVCVWNTSTDEFTTEIRSADFFTKDNGYSEDDIEWVTDLLISESVELSHPGQSHYVMRIA